ncbi:MAG: hypothetical protein GYB53_18390 [Rhodobacteraceae bacterium]|nr:hypothetical protein [Paracoccaceae bacterium]MBR9819381.1 hypothetical protein [Paracoccaceae bacterium]
MPDIVAELRASAVAGTHVGDTMLRAVQEIERLRAQGEALGGTGQHDAEQYLGQTPVGNEAWSTDQGLEYRRSMEGLVHHLSDGSDEVDLRPPTEAIIDPETKGRDMCDTKEKALTKIDKLTLAMNRLASALEKRAAPEVDLHVSFSDGAAEHVRGSARVEKSDTRVR